MLHLKDCVLAEIHEAFHLLLVSPVTDGGVEEGFLGFLDLRLLPLLQLVLVDFKVNSLNLAWILYFVDNIEASHYFVCSFNFNPPQE